jgi:hypothetical protein
MASLDDILTTAKNVVTAINGMSQTYLSVNGSRISANLTAATLLKIGSGRVAMVSIVIGGSGSGIIYDANNVALTTNPIFTIPDTPGIIFVNLPVVNGIVVVPGTGQTVSVSFS